VKLHKETNTEETDIKDRIILNQISKKESSFNTQFAENAPKRI